MRRVVLKLRREFSGSWPRVLAGCALALALAAGAFHGWYAAPPAHAAGGDGFLVGVNYPWAAYGHDFVRNEWAHDGVVTGGWTYQTYRDSQGLTDGRPSSDQARSGRRPLGVIAGLVGTFSRRSS